MVSLCRSASLPLRRGPGVFRSVSDQPTIRSKSTPHVVVVACLPGVCDSRLCTRVFLRSNTRSVADAQIHVRVRSVRPFVPCRSVKHQVGVPPDRGPLPAAATLDLPTVNHASSIAAASDYRYAARGCCFRDRHQVMTTALPPVGVAIVRLPQLGAFDRVARRSYDRRSVCWYSQLCVYIYLYIRPTPTYGTPVLSAHALFNGPGILFSRARPGWRRYDCVLRNNSHR